jgi:hypothetical protein
LSTSSDAASISTERNCLLLLLYVLEKSNGAASLPAVDGLGRFSRILEGHAKVGTASAGRLLLVDFGRCVSNLLWSVRFPPLLPQFPGSRESPSAQETLPGRTQRVSGSLHFDPTKKQTYHLDVAGLRLVRPLGGKEVDSRVSVDSAYNSGKSY